MWQSLWAGYLEHWYLWTMLVSFPFTALLYCMFAKKPNEVLDDGTIIFCTFLAALSQVAWIILWGIMALLVLAYMWTSFVRWLLAPSKKDAEDIVQTQLRNITKQFNQGNES